MLPSRRDLPKFDGSACLETELLNWFPGSSLPNENRAAISLVHSVPEPNLTSSLFSVQLEYALHLLLSPVTMQQVSQVQLAFERIHGLLDFAFSVVKPAFFVALRL